MNATLSALIFVSLMSPLPQEQPLRPLYIGDLTFEAQNFTNAPSFSMSNALNGSNPIGEPRRERDKRKSKKQRTNELVEILQDLYPDAEIIVYNDHIFVR